MAVVLVVDDDRDMLGVYESVLDSLGHRPVARPMVESGPVTVRRLEAQAVILDLQQPEEALYGLRIIQELRTDPELEELPIILCSGAPEALRDLAHDLDHWKVPVLVKPFPVTALEAALNAAIPAE